MSDSPPARLIVAEVRSALEQGLAPGFPQRVAANALGIAQRELERGPAIPAHEVQDLADAIRSGVPADDALAARLIRLTVAKLEIDQPGYPPFRAWKDG